MPRARSQPQTSLDEHVVEDAELERALEERETLKARAAKARKAYTEADEWAKGMLGRHDLDEAPLRVGRFVVSALELPGRAVAFETSPSRRITIAVRDDG
jgi:hypothetical protein